MKKERWYEINWNLLRNYNFRFNVYVFNKTPSLNDGKYEMKWKCWVIVLFVNSFVNYCRLLNVDWPDTFVKITFIRPRVDWNLQDWCVDWSLYYCTNCMVQRFYLPHGFPVSWKRKQLAVLSMGITVVNKTSMIQDEYYSRGGGGRCGLLNRYRSCTTFAWGSNAKHISSPSRHRQKQRSHFEYWVTYCVEGKDDGCTAEPHESLLSSITLRFLWMLIFIGLLKHFY